jgi:hypothetical protein
MQLAAAVLKKCELLWLSLKLVMSSAYPGLGTRQNCDAKEEQQSQPLIIENVTRMAMVLHSGQQEAALQQNQQQQYCCNMLVPMPVHFGCSTIPL